MHHNVFANPTAAFAVTKSDATTLNPCIIYCGGTGNINVKPANGATVLFKNVNAGTTLPLVVVKVLSSLTTCSSIVGMF